MGGEAGKGDITSGGGPTLNGSRLNFRALDRLSDRGRHGSLEEDQAVEKSRGMHDADWKRVNLGKGKRGDVGLKKRAKAFESVGPETRE